MVALGARPPGAPAGMKLVDTMPTTTSLRSTGLVTLLVVADGTSPPAVAVNVTSVPTAAAGDRKPRAVASVSVNSTSGAASELGSRPALRVGTALDEPLIGSETSWPDEVAPGALPERAEPLAPNAPLRPICPHEARTCGRRASVARVGLSKPVVAAAETGETATWGIWLV